MQDLKRCHASVKHTKVVVDKKNAGPSDGFPFLYLFVQEMAGFQNCWHDTEENMLVDKWYVIVSMTGAEFWGVKEVRKKRMHMHRR